MSAKVSVDSVRCWSTAGLREFRHSGLPEVQRQQLEVTDREVRIPFSSPTLHCSHRPSFSSRHVGTTQDKLGWRGFNQSKQRGCHRNRPQARAIRLPSLNSRSPGLRNPLNGSDDGAFHSQISSAPFVGPHSGGPVQSCRVTLPGWWMSRGPSAGFSPA